MPAHVVWYGSNFRSVGSAVGRKIPYIEIVSNWNVYRVAYTIHIRRYIVIHHCEGVGSS